MHKIVDDVLGHMTLEHKVGQMLCLGFCGTYPHRDILEAIDKYHPAGFRVTPFGRKFTRYFGPTHPGTARVVRDGEPNERAYGFEIRPSRVTAREYVAVLNTLRQRSLDTGAGAPAYFALDWEGNGSANVYAPGMYSFPHAMGLAASGDTDLTRRVAASVAAQLAALGINWIHTPVLDVNTHPGNPEIGTRSFSPDPVTVAEHGLAMFEGYRSGRLVATGKHFPGRGQSALDAHFDVPVIDESPERMRQVHLGPYRSLIDAGLPAIMLAHSAFPALDPTGEIATISKPIVTDVLRGELGFHRVVMTDSFTMGGLVARYEVAEAAIRAVEAGVDLILLKDENALRGEVFDAILNAVRSGRLTEGHVEQSARRVLDVKAEYGLLEGTMGLVDVDRAEDQLYDTHHRQVCTEAAAKSLVALRVDASCVPLPNGAGVLVVEEAGPHHLLFNNTHIHVGALYEALLERGVDACYTDYAKSDFESAWPIIQRQAEQADVIVYTAHYERGSDPRRTNYEQIQSLGKPAVCVANCPYGMLVPDEVRTVLVTFSPTTESMAAAADVLVGRTEPTAKLSFDPALRY